MCYDLQMGRSRESKTIGDCPVCREGMLVGQAVNLSCGHLFHRACIHRWAQQSTTCPLCRQAYYVLEQRDPYAHIRLLLASLR